MSENAVNKGYLFENYRLFHLRDRRAQKVEPHYHEFDKLVMLHSGKVDYIIEGASYSLQPGDILFVRHNAIHKPIISAERDYERTVIWIRPGYLESLGGELGCCFELSQSRRSCLCRPGGEVAGRAKRLASELETALSETERFNAAMLADSVFLQLMVELCRCVLEESPAASGDTDPKLDEVLRHINANLEAELDVDSLAAMCYLSRYYFMRRFKEYTGYTVHNYICQKRLAAAAELLESGMGVTDCAAKVGFPEYSSFLRAFKKMYSATPSEYLRRRQRLDSEYDE